MSLCGCVKSGWRLEADILVQRQRLWHLAMPCGQAVTAGIVVRFPQRGQCPQSRLARLKFRINWRISSGTFRPLPRDRDFHRQNKRQPARYQPITVAGLTITKALRMPGTIQQKLQTKLDQKF
jgi:hypothetical protein